MYKRRHQGGGGPVRVEGVWVGQKMSQHPRLRYVVNIKGKYDYISIGENNLSHDKKNSVSLTNYHLQAVDSSFGTCIRHSFVL